VKPEHALAAAIVLVVSGAIAFAGCSSSGSGGSDGGPACQGACGDATTADRPARDVQAAPDVVDSGLTCAIACEKQASLKGCPDPGCAGACARQELLCQGAIGIALFEALLACEVGAHYTCSATSPPLPVTSYCDAAAVAAAGGCSPEAGADAGCTKAGSASACAACCAGEHPGGADTYGVALTHCACTLPPGACISQCAETECNAIVPPAGSACAKCLARAVLPDGGCAQPLSEACGLDVDCVAYEACLTTSGCAKM